MTTYDSIFVQSLRTEINQLIEKVQGQYQNMVEMRHEIEILITERDNALLRVEELERELNRVAEYGRQFQGGVNPNA